ncbi:MAG: DUF5665 domain-containing protein [Candidatus Saccharibacteria bacterium]
MVKKFIKKIRSDNEKGARTSLLEELFYDFNRNRHQVFVMNFVRGIFFGVGSVLGATVVIALLVGLLSLFTDLPGGIGGFVQSIIDAANQSRLK